MTVDVPGLLDAVAATVREHADELTALDRAIGDGDHGINMRRGFDAVAESTPQWSSLAPGEALAKAGTTLVMKVGGASGPLYGSLLLSMGKALGGEISSPAVAAAFSAGVAAVKKRGRSEAGEKTMLDVLVPASEALAAAVAEGADAAALAARVVDAAAAGLEATRAMQARKGRASFLGERSVGHLDPGARSSFLIIETVCGRLEERP